jgi:hypothetical protein
MNQIGRMLKAEPAMIGAVTAAVLPVLLVFGLDPEVGGSLATAVTVLAGLWVRSRVWSPATMERKEGEGL